MNGVILKALSNNYYVFTEGETLLCKARGIFRKNKISPLPGDRVKVEIDGDTAVIDEIMPRKNCMTRPPVANLDMMFVVVSTTNPQPCLSVTDKLIAICEENGVEPVILINKSDLADGSQLEAIYKKAGFKTYVMCAENGDGCGVVSDLAEGRICAFGGNSGVGKSSIMNKLVLESKSEIGETCAKTGRGKNTTKRVELFAFRGGFIADTPGFGDVSSEECLKAEKLDIAPLFREFEPYAGKCRFDDCAHINEPDCEVKSAVLRGDIPQSRYDSYKLIYQESLARKHY